MFTGARFLLAFAVLAVTLSPVAAVRAQSVTLSQGGNESQTEGVTWLLPGMSGHPDSLMSICAPPPVRPKAAVKRKVVRSSAPKFTFTPTIKPKPKRAVRKIKAPEQPRMLCPQVQLGPTMMGTLDPDESVIPLPGDFAADVPDMPLVSPRELPLGDIPTVTVADGGRRIGPLIWLFGGGAGVAVFKKFIDGGGEGGGNPRIPAPPNPPTIENPEVPPPVTTTPEPGTLLLVGTGLAGVAGAWRRRQQKSVASPSQDD